MAFDRIVHAFAGNTLIRAAEGRPDAGRLREMLMERATRVAVFCGDRPLITIPENGGRMEVCWLRGEEADRLADEDFPMILLGTGADGTAHFACRLKTGGGDAPPAELDARGKYIDLRSLAVQGLIDRAELSMLAQARSLAAWHERHRFCANCGAPCEQADGGGKRTCPDCRAEHFPRTDPVAIMLVHRDRDILLGRQRHFPPGSYSALAGFVEPGESIEEAARREIFEESGVRVGRVTYHSSQPWPFPSNLMIGLFGEALGRELNIDFEELEDCRWFSEAEAEAMVERTHEDGLITPPDISIACQLIRGFLAGEA